MLRKLRAFKRLFLFLWGVLTLAFVLGAVEFVGRRILPAFIIHSRTFQPYLMEGYWTNHDGPANIREMGYEDSGSIYVYPFRGRTQGLDSRWPFVFTRGLDLQEVRPTTDLWVYAVGASVAAGGWVSPVKWYQFLETKLSAALGRRVHVIPAAVPSYVSAQERIALDFTVFPRCPDLIIFLDGFNDANAALTGNRPGDPFNMGLLYKRYYSVWFDLELELANKSVVFNHWLTNRIYGSIWNTAGQEVQDPQRLENYRIGTASIFLENVYQMLRTCKARGLNCIDFLQPARAVSERNVDPDFALPVIERLRWESYQEIELRMKRKLRGLQVVDLTHGFDSKALIKEYVDECHFNRDGEEHLADIIFPTVLKSLRKIASKSPLRCSDGWVTH